jgi:hypothetical protein
LQDFVQEKFLEKKVKSIKQLVDFLRNMKRDTTYTQSSGAKKFTCDGIGLHFLDEAIHGDSEKNFLYF